jgi:hypothetical protein
MRFDAVEPAGQERECDASVTRRNLRGDFLIVVSPGGRGEKQQDRDSPHRKKGSRDFPQTQQIRQGEQKGRP